MVLSADIRSILTNEGHLFDGQTAKEVSERIVDARANVKSGAIKAQTSKGIRLGMSKSQVRKLLGKPHKTLKSKRFQADEFIYTRSTPKDSDGVSVKHTNYYLFRNEKLYYVELSRDLVGAG